MAFALAIVAVLLLGDDARQTTARAGFRCSMLRLCPGTWCMSTDPCNGSGLVRAGCNRSDKRVAPDEEVAQRAPAEPSQATLAAMLFSIMAEMTSTAPSRECIIVDHPWLMGSMTGGKANLLSAGLSQLH